jgi:tetratricopeptide (TPR) repeat protein
MSRSHAQKKTKKQKSRGAARAAKKAKPKAAAKAPIRKRVSKAKVPSGKTKSKETPKAKKKTLPSTRRLAKKGKKAMQTKSKRSAEKTQITSAPPAPLRLLRRTKATAAALALLEKGIEHIHKREFKKARGELKTLLETYPGEMDILARARSYVQICDREDPAQKKPPATTDQLYALGILEHNKANYDAAISYFLQSLETHPEADYIYYSVAASLAMKGNLAESMKNLRKAIELNEESRVYAKNDNDFSALDTHQEFIELVGLAPAAESKS